MTPFIHGWRSQKYGWEPTDSVDVSIVNISPGYTYAAGLSPKPELNSEPSPEQHPDRSDLIGSGDEVREFHADVK